MPKKLFKILFSLLLSVLLLVLAAIGYVLTTYDDDDYRQALTSLVAGFTDYKLAVAGPFHVNISFTPSISFSSVTLSSEDDEDKFVFDKLDFQFAVRPLLTGIFKVTKLNIDGGEITMAIEAKEVDDDFFADDPAAIFPDLILERVSIRDINLVIKRQTNSKITRGHLDELTVRDVLNHKPLSFAARGNVDSIPFSLQGKFGALSTVADINNPYPVKLELSNRLLNLNIFGKIADIKRLKGLDLSFNAGSSDISPLLKMFNLQIPLTGSLQARGRLLGDRHSPVLSDFNLSLNRAKLVDLRLSGSAKNLAAMQGLELTLSGELQEPEILKWLLPVDLYAISHLTFSGNVVSRSNGYLVNNLSAQGTNSHGLRVDMSGHGLLADFKAVQPFADLDVLIKVDSPDTASVQGYLLENLPELGRAVGSVRLTAPSHEDLAVEDIDVRLGRQEDLQVTATGRIAKIPLSDIPNTGIDLRIKAEAIRTERIAYLFSYSLPEIGPVSLDLHFFGSKIKSKITGIKLAAGNKDEITLDAVGDLVLGDMREDNYLQNVNLVVNFFALPSQETFDLSLPNEIKGNGIVNKIGEKGKFTGKLSVGRTDMTAELLGLFSDERPRIEGKISAAVFHLDDFIQQPIAENQPPETPDSAFIFSREPLLFSKLNLLDLSLDVDLHQVEGKKSQIDKVAIGIRLQDGKLAINPVSFIFKDGFFTGKVSVDSTLSPPRMSLDVKADDVDLGSFLSYLKNESPIEGNFNLFTDISSSGLSPHDIADNLEGKVEMTLENGKVPRSTMELLTVDLFGWTLSKTIRSQKYTKINCGILGLTAEKGILTTQVFLLETPRVSMTGKGSVDLGTETIDLVLLPKKKKKFWSTITPVHINGALQEPNVRAIPAKSTGLAAAGVIFAPQFFLPASGLNYLWEQITGDDDSGPKSPCLQKLMEGK